MNSRTAAALTESPLDLALELARKRYLQRRPKTLAMHEQARRVMPGGNTRTVLYHEPAPLRVANGRGAYLTDVDGHHYLNLLGEYTAGLFGHSHPVIRAAIDDALDGGINLSAHNVHEVELARIVCERFPSIDKVRFTNSGTEANLLAVSAARFFTGRSKVLVMNGGYHGGLLYFGNGGIPINAPFPYLLATYNDVDGTRELIRANQSELACVLLEPMLGSGGCIPASKEFLRMARDETSRSGSVLIFDEVMTSRLSAGGAQQIEAVIPDMTTLGKYMGGGMSFGAFGGNDQIMNMFDPESEGCIPHAGTFNNNSLTMAAGAAAMGKVFTAEAAERLNRRGDDMRQRLNAVCREKTLNMQFCGKGSLMCLHGTAVPVSSPVDLLDADDRLKALLFLELLEHGYYLARRGFIALMLPVTDEEVTGFVNAFDSITSQHLELLQI